MDNVFNDITDTFNNVKTSLPDLESVVNNLSEVIWSIDLSQEYLSDHLSQQPFGQGFNEVNLWHFSKNH